MMSRLIVLVHPRHTGPGFTSTSPALKRRDRRYRAGCAPSAIEKGEVGMEGVCSLRLPQRSLVDGLVGFECRHLAASRWTPREGPNSCPTDVVVDDDDDDDDDDDADDDDDDDDDDVDDDDDDVDDDDDDDDDVVDDDDDDDDDDDEM